MNIRRTTRWVLMLLPALLWGALACQREAAPDSPGHEDEHGHTEGEHEEGEETHTDEHGDEHADEGGHEAETGEVHLEESQIAEFGIELLAVGPGALTTELEVLGEVTLNADRVAHAGPRTGGLLTSVRGTLGQVVRAGETLAIVRSPELAEAKSDYRIARGRRDLAQERFSREAQLREKGITPEQDYLDANQALEEAELELQFAEQSLHALGLSESQVEKLAQGHGVEEASIAVSAPINGTILEKHASAGEMVEAGAELYLLADLSEVWVQLTINQSELAGVRPGIGARILSETGDEATGAIDFVSGLVEGATRSATARVRLPNPEGIWRPGQFVTGKLEAGQVEVPLRVPSAALVTHEEAPHVFVRSEHGFEVRPVTLGREGGDQVEILDGLEAGEWIAVSGTFLLRAELGKGEAGHGHDH